jgi:predicted transcriptional regulator
VLYLVTLYSPYGIANPVVAYTDKARAEKAAEWFNATYQKGTAALESGAVCEEIEVDVAISDLDINWDYFAATDR